MLELGSSAGLSSVSLSTLAKEQGISKAAIFHHFKSREALVDELFTYCRSLSYSLVTKISLEGEAIEVLSRATNHWLDVYEQPQMRDFYRIIEMEAPMHSKAATLKKTLDEMIQGQSFVLLETLSASNRLHIEDLDFAVTTFSSVLQRFLSLTLLENQDDSEWKIQRFLTQFCTFYQNLHS